MIKRIGTMAAVMMIAGASASGRDVVEVEVMSIERPPLIQMAILLDTSRSMSGLIDQAKTQLWSIVNEFATTRKEGKIPELHVALYEYGKSSVPAATGYIRQILPLTTDLDKVSEELFVLKTNGGAEYCGMVIQSAVESLAWSDNNDDFKVMFIAGNEPFTQGGVDYRMACKAAIEKGVIVNTIHCGSYEDGVNGKWQDGAALADGSYMHIDQNRKAVHIESPYDADITRLGVELNSTYIAYGVAGEVGKARQEEQDLNALNAAPGSGTQRMAAKSSGQYRNSGWDLVDAVTDDKVELAEVKAEDLPEEMQRMNEKEREDFVKAKTEARANIQQQIKELDAQRRTYIDGEMKKRADKGEDTLEKVMIKTVREQITRKNFRVEEGQ